ncbi:Exo-glucosaminidase LytG precursor [Lentilactobacillus parabuchneri]|uniref:Exo-glucosaminidase LytG n=2 Tax=Lentilactobacillus parabuchneri TaxID=152331 RepID=A0A1X1FDP8_9LACO|nr:Exo-glucosaminidase LytG precursor [Lentilactobacillus parabuchneri]ORN27644.1 Exo-glucosaminidase LytG precursor [Lentilactobacillus parabuchneri]TLQ32540.1 mannosyl-glycoprotein endo-beta-N-acetylglucosamidase [Lentilactobacillus parabuchneri]
MVKYKKGRKRRAKKANMILMLILVGTALVIILGFHALSENSYNENNLQSSQNEIAVEHRKFINKLAPQAQRLQGQYNILPSITLAQAILESDWGTSKLASKYYNLFGVKAQDGSTNSVYLNTQEFVNGRYVTVKARFQVYQNWNESLADHAKLLAYGTKWNSQQYKDVVSATNYLQAADGLQQDGYATDPTYTRKLISLIRQYKLYQYDD